MSGPQKCGSFQKTYLRVLLGTPFLTDWFLYLQQQREDFKPTSDRRSLREKVKEWTAETPSAGGRNEVNQSLLIVINLILWQNI